MSSVLDPWGGPAAARWRRASILLTALALLMPTLYAAHLALVEARDPLGFNSYDYIEEGGDYFAAARVFTFEGAHVSVTWTASRGAPDRVLLVRSSELPDLLLGAEPQELLGEWAAGDGGTFAHGQLDFPYPDIDCSKPGGGCVDDSIPSIIWMKGDAWVGTRPSELKESRVEVRGPGQYGGWSGPVGFMGASNTFNLVPLAPWWLGLGIAFAAGALGAGARWFVLDRRSHQGSLGLAAFKPSDATGTDELLRLVHLGELYVGAIKRSFLVAALALVLGSGFVMYLALPPLIAELEAHFIGLRLLRDFSIFYFIFAAPFGAAMAGLFLARSYGRARRELKRWRKLVGEFEARARSILEA